jgi:hypothetical protein
MARMAQTVPKSSATMDKKTGRHRSAQIEMIR